MMLRLIADITNCVTYDMERHCTDSVVPPGLSSRFEQIPGTPLRLRAGLLSVVPTGTLFIKGLVGPLLRCVSVVAFDKSFDDELKMILKRHGIAAWGK